MIKYGLKRILQIIPTMLVLSALVFYFIRFLPEIPASERVSFTGENATHKLYFEYMKGVVVGDFGTSMRTSRPVSDELVRRFPYTLSLAFGGIVVATVIGIFLGVIAAVYHNKWLDHVIMVVSLITTSMPLFFLAVMFMLFFSLYLGLLPSQGVGSWKSAIMPVLTLGLPAVGFITRTTRSAMLDALNQDHIRASRARGIPEMVVVYIHAFRNTLIPIMTAVGVRFGELLAGTVLVENAFSIPGLGRMVLDSIVYRDYYMMMGAIICLAFAFLIINIIVDLLYSLVDPRIHYGKTVQ